jgi:cyclohexa-1,5-dienecarbonyl-CoA hydratase
MADEVRVSQPEVATPVKVWLTHDDALLRVRLARPKANLIDDAMIRALSATFASQKERAGLRAVLLDAEGPNFSFGASVEEHLADRCAAMLAALDRLIVTMLEFPAPILVAVQGQCLGGGLELALAGSRIIASPDASLGQPEIKLGVFAPAASVLLPLRVSQPVAEDLLWSGRSIDGNAAHEAGLVQQVSDDPEAAAIAYFESHLVKRSAAALACAVAAVRGPVIARVKRRLAEVERIYLDTLMATRDANEGLSAFLARRAPSWEHR